jgi:hypothetical protein
VRRIKVKNINKIIYISFWLVELEESFDAYVITNLYEIAYTGSDAAKKTEVLAKIPGVEAMTTALEIKNSLKAWVDTTTAALHTTGIFYFGIARSLKSVDKMIEELEKDTPVTPYCNSRARVRIGENYF